MVEGSRLLIFLHFPFALFRFLVPSPLLHFTSGTFDKLK